MPCIVSFGVYYFILLFIGKDVRQKKKKDYLALAREKSHIDILAKRVHIQSVLVAPLELRLQLLKNRF